MEKMKLNHQNNGENSWNEKFQKKTGFVMLPQTKIMKPIGEIKFEDIEGGPKSLSLLNKNNSGNI